MALNTKMPYSSLHRKKKLVIILSQDLYMNLLWQYSNILWTILHEYSWTQQSIIQSSRTLINEAITYDVDIFPIIMMIFWITWFPLKSKHKVFTYRNYKSSYTSSSFWWKLKMSKHVCITRHPCISTEKA